MTDAERVLQLFRNFSNIEINHRKIVDDLRISEYTGRIVDAREVLGCTCGKDKDTCTAREHIVNTRKGYYKFVTPTKPFTPPEAPKLSVEDQLEKLRDQYREAKKRGDEVKMRMIEISANQIKNAKPTFIQQVQQALT